MLLNIFTVLAVAWPVSEVALGLFARANSASATVKDRGSLMVLWVTISLGVWAGFVVRSTGVGSIGSPRSLVLSAAVVLLVSGVAVRWAAIFTLGRYFTANVAIHPGQRIIRTGAYRYVRHPAYSGLLLAFLGIGVAFDNWIGLLAMFVPIVAALLYRMRVEERALAEMLGPDYADYCAGTKRLIPGVY